MKESPHVRESGIRNPANFCCWNPESRGLESGIHNVWNLESTMVSIPESRKLEPGIQRPGSGIQDLHGFSYIGRKEDLAVKKHRCLLRDIFKVHINPTQVLLLIWVQ